MSERWKGERLSVGGLAGAALLALTLALTALLAVGSGGSGVRWRQPGVGAIPLAVLGDSDSHSYGDSLSFPRDSNLRGGRYRASSLQWTEAVSRLRPGHLDLGPWGVWGVPVPIGRAAQWLGLSLRQPRKEDYLHNFAYAGAGCDDLTRGGGRQTQHLLDLLASDRERWSRGVVVVRIGINDLGTREALDAFASDPVGSRSHAVVEACLRHIEEAVGLVRSRHPQVRLVLVGIFNNAHWARFSDRWQDPVAQERIARALDRFDHGLQAMTLRFGPAVFFDERSWFAARWGGRDGAGAPAYRAVALGPGLRVANTSGDEPSNAVLADGHAGTAWNAMWAASLIDLLNGTWQLRVPAVPPDEIVRLVRAVTSGEPRGAGQNP